MPQLIFYLENDYPQIHDLLNGKVTIGRNKDNAITVRDSCVSVYHAEITRNNDGRCQIADLGSHNGTYVNGVKVDKAVLCAGDRIKFGAVKAIFESSPKNEKNKTLSKEIEVKAEKLAELEKSIEEKTGQLSSKIEELESKSTQLKKQKDDERKNLLVIRKQLESAHQKTGHLQSGMEARRSELETLDKKRVSLGSDLKILRTSTSEALEEKEKLDGELATLRKLNKQAAADLEEKLRAARDAAEKAEKVNSLETQLFELQSDLENRESSLHELKQSVESASGRLKAEEEKLSELQKTVAATEEELKDKKAALEESKNLEARLNDLENRLTERTSTFDQLEKDIAAATTGLEEKREALREAEAIIEKAGNLESRVAELENLIRDHEANRDELTTRISAQEAERDKLQEQIASSEQSLKTLTEELESKQSAAGEIESKMHKNEELIRVAAMKLGDMESNLNNSRDALARSEDTRKSLTGESKTLSRIISEKSTVLQRMKNKILAAKHGTAVVACPPLRVIKPWMKALVHYFHHGAGVPDKADRIVPVGYYGLAACTGGSMHREVDTIPPGDDPVLLLLDGEPEVDKNLIESMVEQLPDRLLLICNPGSEYEEDLPFSELPPGVAGIVSVDNRIADLFDEHSTGLPHLRIPLPVPLDTVEWDLSTPLSKRNRGIFVSTEGYKPDSPIHRARIDLLKQIITGTGKSVTLYRNDPADPFPALPIPSEQLVQISEPLGYIDYLTLMGEHQLVTGFGATATGSDITGDALLARTVFIGGNAANTVDELLFREVCISENDTESASRAAIHLLSDQTAFAEAVDHSQNVAPQLLDFDSVRDRIGEFVHFIAANPGGV